VSLVTVAVPAIDCGNENKSSRPPNRYGTENIPLELERVSEICSTPQLCPGEMEITQLF